MDDVVLHHLDQDRCSGSTTDPTNLIETITDSCRNIEIGKGDILDQSKSP